MGFIMLEPFATLRLLCETEVAKILAVKTSTLRRWRWAGTGPRFRKIGAAVRYHPQDLEDYLAESVRTSTSDPGDQVA